MKVFLQSLFLLVSICTYAQVEPILDHHWTLEKVVINDDTIMAEPSPHPDYDNYPMINFNHSIHNDIPYSSFDFVDLHPTIIFNDENSSFFIDEMQIDFGSHHETAAADAFRLQFISIDGNLTVEYYDTFTYIFSDENDLIYLEITNPVGDLAVFWAETLSNTNFDETQFTIYPNPVINQLHVEGEQAQIKRVEIFTLNGKQVLDVNFQNAQPIDVSNLAKGMYLVKVETESGILTKKLVKE